MTTGYTYAGLFAQTNMTLLLSTTRAYNPANGKWLNVDPIREPGGINLTGYVGGSPMMGIDPLGLVIETGWDGINVGIDIISIGANGAAGNYFAVVVDVVGLAYDVTAVVIPGLPGGAGTIIQTYRGSKLARNLDDIGEGATKGLEACHHIVARGSKFAKEAQDKLKALGIDAAVNGVALPKDFHNKIHTGDYYKMINDLSRTWHSVEDAVVGLRKADDDLIKRSLQQAQ